MKKCSKCNNPKPLSEFHKDKWNKDGLTCVCKECDKESKKKYRKTEDGLLTQIYDNQKEHSKRRGNAPPSYTREELKVWAKKQSIWSKLFGNWEKSGYKKDLIPSCDRDDDYKPYTLDSIELRTWEENNTKARKDIKEGRNNKHSKAVEQYTLGGVFVKEYYSAAQAARETGIQNTNIGKCCKGCRRHSHAGGFVWKFKN